MWIRGFSPAGLVIAAFAAVSGGADDAVYAGEVRGTVVLSPQCPGAAQIGKECPAAPIATTVDIFRSPNDPSIPGKPYRRIKSDQQGHFRISLAADIYWFIAFVPEPYEKIRAAKPQEVTVTSGTTTITLVVDTGLR